jgi:AcrR family transcriptional regulator
MSDIPSSSPTRTKLVQAANQVVLTKGVTGLTLEAVAREAGVSKGGLLYHFPSKQALIEGMISELYEEYFDRLARAADEDDSVAGKGRWLRAYARSAFAGTEETTANSRATLLAAAAGAPDLLQPIRDHFARWQELAESDGLDPAHATVIRLAVEGAWFADFLGLAPPAAALRAEVLERILELTQEPDGSESDAER